VETHRQVFGWILGLLAEAGLVKGKRIGIGATSLEANALRSIMRRRNGPSYEEFLTELAQRSGISTPTREDLARVNRNGLLNSGFGDPIGARGARALANTESTPPDRPR